MLERLMTPEEQESFVQRLWAESDEQFKRDVASTLQRELAAAHHTRARSFIETEVRRLVNAELERRKPELEAFAKAHVDRMFKKCEEEVAKAIPQVVKSTLGTMTADLKSKTSTLLDSIIYAAQQALKGS